LKREDPVVGRVEAVPVPVTRWRKSLLTGVDLRNTLPASDPRHTLVVGFVWQSAMLTGRLARPVSADAVMLALAPTLTVATAKTPVPVATARAPVSVDPGMSTIPGSLLAARATMSGTGFVEADRSNVLTPAKMGAGSVFEQSKLSCTFAKTPAVGVKPNTYVCVPPPGISTGVLGVPVSSLVKGFVV
jgi:hypothetical protein